MKTIVERYPDGRVKAIDDATGVEVWSADPVHVDENQRRALKKLAIAVARHKQDEAVQKGMGG